MEDNYKHSDITDLIIRGFYNVYNRLGYGFLEKVYENAMMIELTKLELDCQTQVPVAVYYDDVKVGNYVADMIVEEKVIVEIKSSESLCEEHEAQLTNYLRATNIEVGLLLNFGKKPQLKRKVFSSSYKPNHNKP